MNTQTVTVKATGEVEQRTLGSYKYLLIRTATGPLQISFDGSTWQTVNQNDAFGPLAPAPSRIWLRAVDGVASTAVFTYGATLLRQQDTAQSNAKSYALGNLGIATGAAAAGGLPACDGNGFLQITNNMALAVPGTRNNNRRQIVTFSLSAQSPAPLNLLDPYGYVFMTVLAGQQISLPTDSSFILSGAGGTAWVTVGQIFLAN